jgi:hypothetical protein
VAMRSDVSIEGTTYEGTTRKPAHPHLCASI